MQICKKNIFLYRKYMHNYIQLHLQPYLSEVYSEHFSFFYNIFVKPLGGSKVDSALHPFKVDKMSSRNFWELSGKK